MKNCPVCGAQMIDTAAFCTNCGARFAAAESAAQAVMQAEPPEAPGYEAPERPAEASAAAQAAQEAPAADAQPAPVWTPAQGYAAPRQDAPQQQGYAQPNYAPQPQAASAGKDWNRPLSTWAYALSLFLMGLPLVGFIIQIIWAVGGTNSVNRQNLARGYLFLRVCLAVLAILICVVLIALMAPLMRRFMNEFDYFFNSFRYAF